MDAAKNAAKILTVLCLSALAASSSSTLGAESSEVSRAEDLRAEAGYALAAGRVLREGDGATGDRYALSGECRTPSQGARYAVAGIGPRGSTCCLCPMTPIFTDGFESGDTSAWSQTVP